MPDLMRVRTVFTYGTGSPGLMTQYFSNDAGSFNSNDGQTAVNRVRDAMNTLTALWPNTFSWTVSGDVDAIHDTNGEVFDQFGVDPANGVGTAFSGMGPLPVGVLLRARTNAFVSGRRLVGRTYFVPIAQGSENTPTVTPGTMAAVKSFGDALLSAGLTLQFPYVWSRPRPATAVGPGRPPGPARLARVGSSAPAVGYSCSPKFVVLTSRRD